MSPRRDAPSAKRDRGSSAVEFALIAPLIFMVLFAIIDFGRLEYTQVVMTSAAREGARAYALGLTDWKLRAQNAALPTVVSASQVSASTACPTPPDPSASITVTIQYPFNYITPVGVFMRMIGGTGLGTTQTITGSAAFRCLG